MPLRLIPSFLFYCYITTITPGPANIVSLSAGLIYGKKRAMKMWLGIFTAMWIISLSSAVIICFIGTALESRVKYFKWIGAAYIVYLAVKTFKSTGDPASEDRECNFFTGMLTEFTNVKIIIFTFTALGTFVLPYSRSLTSLFAVACFLPFTAPVCNIVWIFAGVSLKKLFNGHRKTLNIIMGILLLVAAAFILI